MSDVKALELAKRELDDLIATGEKLVAQAGSAGETIKGTQLADSWPGSHGVTISSERWVARTVSTIVLFKRRVQRSHLQ